MIDNPIVLRENLPIEKLETRRSLELGVAFLLILATAPSCASGARRTVLERLGLTSRPYTVVAERTPESSRDGGVAILIARAPQPSRSNIRRLREDGFRTILNLRGEAPDESWYQEESAACREHGLKLIDLRISSRNGPDDGTVNRLVAILTDRTNYPLLLHCAGGVHRTGFAVGVYRMVAEGATAESVIKEMYEYGFGYQGARRQALVRKIREIEPERNDASNSSKP